MLEHALNTSIVEYSRSGSCLLYHVVILLATISTMSLYPDRHSMFLLCSSMNNTRSFAIVPSPILLLLVRTPALALAGRPPCV